MQLNDEWHSLLPKTDKGNLLRNKYRLFYGFEFESRWYAVAMWTSPIAQNRLSFPAIELRRLAICEEAPKNTATRMLRLMREDIKKRHPELQRAISYQAEEHHHGTIYKADNWKAAAHSNYSDWHPDKDRNKEQTRSGKVRWERFL